MSKLPHHTVSCPTNPVVLLCLLACVSLSGGLVVAAEPSTKEAPASSWVTMGPDGKLKYRADAQGNRIPDFSMVGYGTGIVPIPGTPGGVVVPTKLSLAPSSGDQTARIQEALDALAKLSPGSNGWRGALLLKRGEYPVSGQLFIRASGIVLRGEGDDLKTGTVIRDTGKDKDPLIMITGDGKPPLLEAPKRAIVDGHVPVGSFRLRLDRTAGLKVGDTVMVERGCNDAWIKSIGADRPGVDWPVTFPIVKSDRVITAIDGPVVTLDAPITTAIESRFGGGTLAKYSWPGRICLVGVENLMGFSNHTSPQDENHSWVFIRITSAQHVFVNHVTGQHFSYAAVHIARGAKWVTVQDSKNLDPISRVAGARRYSFTIDGQLSLVRRCYSRHGRHDFVANDYLVTGPNVFLDCKADNAISELGPHRQWTSGMLLDNITTSDRISLYKRHDLGRAKGATPPYHLGHGWASANCVAWNCNVRSILLVENPPGAVNWAIGCKAGQYQGNGIFESKGTPVAIRSLYEAQLAERMKKSGSRF